MMKIKKGIIKKVLTDEQYELIKKGVIDPKTIKIIDTLRSYRLADGTELFYLPFRIAYKEVDKGGKEKFIFNEEKEIYEKSYTSSRVINAYDKEMRILLEMKEYNPVKIVVEEIEKKEKKYYKVICVQDQLSGILSPA